MTVLWGTSNIKKESESFKLVPGYDLVLNDSTIQPLNQSTKHVN